MSTRCTIIVRQLLKGTDMDQDKLWNKLYAQMDKGLITYTEMLEELHKQGFQFGINEGIAR